MKGCAIIIEVQTQELLLHGCMPLLVCMQMRTVYQTSKRTELLCPGMSTAHIKHVCMSMTAQGLTITPAHLARLPGCQWSRLGR